MFKKLHPICSQRVNFACEALESRQMLSAAPAIYYVSPSGNDSNPGTSVDAPWRTAAKVDATSFNPGDQILFQRGGQWRESITATSDGAAGAPIVYGAYGDDSLAKPLFIGSDVLDAASFTLVTGTTYSLATSTAINWVFDNHQFTHESNDALSQSGGNSSDATANLNYVEAHAGSFFYNSSARTLYVNLGSAPAGHTITAAVREDAVFNNLHSYLTFQDLAITETAHDDAGYAFRAQGGTNVHVIDCDASLAGKHHFGDIDSTEFLGMNLTATQAPPDFGFGGSSAYVSFSDDTQSNTTAQWINITWSQQNGPYPIFISHGATNAVGNLLIQNAISSGYGTGIDIQSTGHNEVVHIIGGHFDDSDVNVTTDNSIVRGVLITGVDGAISIAGTHNIVENCVFSGFSPDVGAGHDGTLIDNGTNNVLRFNTFESPASIGPAITITNGNSNTQIYANIFSTPIAVRLFLNDGSATLSSDTNVFATTPLFQSGDGTQTQSISLQQWHDLGHDGNSVVEEPQFTDATGDDFSLRVNSPAINLYNQTPISAPATDFAGNPRLIGNGYDAGAFEFQRAVNASQTTLVANQSTAPVGSTIILTAAVRSAIGAAAGNVQFFDGANLLGSAALQSDGSAIFQTTALTSGNHSITAQYQGDGASVTPSTSAAVAETIYVAPFKTTVAKSTLPASFIAGASVHGTLSVNFTNAGDSFLNQKFTINVFASINGTLDNGAVKVLTVTRSLLLKPGQTISMAIPVTSLPAKLPAGKYVLLSQVVDPSGTRSNAFGGPAVRVIASAVKLVPSFQKVTLPAKAKAGAKISAAATVKILNSGNIASTGMTTVSLYARSQTDQSLTLLKTVKQRMTIGVGKTVSVAVTLGVIPHGLAGTYQIVASVTDPAGKTVMANSNKNLKISA